LTPLRPRRQVEGLAGEGGHRATVREGRLRLTVGGDPRGRAGRRHRGDHDVRAAVCRYREGQLVAHQVRARDGSGGLARSSP
ncbi:MAG TPA: hypothetical protein VEF71_23335, partial [Streptosporangiaceae bacterium]|nr:hypothetical protein [Streptosporangiaceae bacterium]